MMNLVGRMMIRPFTFGDSRMLIAQTAVAGTALTGGTGETTLDTINIPAGLMGPNGRIDFWIAGTHAGTAGTKVWRVKIGGTTVCSCTMATTGGANFQMHGSIVNVNSQSSQRVFNISPRGTDALITANPETTASIDTSPATTITVTGQLSNAADTMTRTAYWFDVTRA